jgi:sulfofructose kinase
MVDRARRSRSAVDQGATEIAIAAAGSRRFDVVGFGFNTLDHVCVTRQPPGYDRKQRLEAYFQQPGGQVPTALVALQRWGLRTAYVGPLGDDLGGELQASSLSKEGVDLSGCSLRRGVDSQTSVVFVDRVSGERTVLWQRPAELALRVDELDPQILGAGRALLMDADEPATALRVARWARAAGALIMLDVDEPGPHSAELLALADAVVVSGSFPRRLTGCTDLRAALRRMRAMGPRFVAATLCAGGAAACAANEELFVSAFPIAAADTTSAGDLFHAGCLYGLLNEWPPRRTLRFAAAAAALECTALGGRSAIPPLERALALAGG